MPARIVIKEGQCEACHIFIGGQEEHYLFEHRGHKICGWCINSWMREELAGREITWEGFTTGGGKEVSKCSRCGNNNSIEKHHIIHKANGGDDSEANLKPLCSACHDYQHALEDIIGHIRKCETRHQYTRKKIWQYRLSVLGKLNTPTIIKRTGKYRSYWLDVKTHYMSREVKVFVPAKEQMRLEV